MMKWNTNIKTFKAWTSLWNPYCLFALGQDFESKYHISPFYYHGKHVGFLNISEMTKSQETINTLHNPLSLYGKRVRFFSPPVYYYLFFIHFVKFVLEFRPSILYWAWNWKRTFLSCTAPHLNRPQDKYQKINTRINKWNWKSWRQASM